MKGEAVPTSGGSVMDIAKEEEAPSSPFATADPVFEMPVNFDIKKVMVDGFIRLVFLILVHTKMVEWLGTLKKCYNQKLVI